MIEWMLQVVWLIIGIVILGLMIEAFREWWKFWH